MNIAKTKEVFRFSRVAMLFSSNVNRSKEKIYLALYLTCIKIGNFVKSKELFANSCQ